MDHYSGADPIVSLINYSRDFKNSIRYALFYRDTEIVVDEIVETASFLLCHDTQYERHFRRSHIVPGSETDSITFYDSDGQTESVSPVQPNKGNFVDRTHTYPREATNHLTDCEWCSAGSKTCPNCGGESVVSCPECYSHRGGDCSRCEGTGKVDCGDCHGSGTCGTCDGDGRNPCTNCSGNGTVEFEEYQEETCQNCNGTGSTGENSCSACNGSGTVTRKYMRTEQCGPCSGRGTVQCTTCRGSGYCPRCSGSGKVDDEKCGGTGRCQFCQGEGTKTCTTCRGSASVTCPVCEGVNQVLRYTTDVFEYKHMIDTDTVHPGLFTDRTDDIEDASTITLPDLTETTVQNYLGLVNGNIKERLNEAISAYEGLVKTADERQYSNGVNRSDKINQDKLYDSLVRKIESTWDSTASDSYHTDYQLELDDQARRQDHDDIYQNLLFQTGTYNLVPLSLINLWMGETKKQLYAIGPEDDYEVKYPSFKLSPVKVTLFSAFLLGAIGSVATYPAVYGTMLAFSLAGMTLPVYLTAGLLSVPALIGWGYTVYRTRTSEDPSVVTVVGGDDALNTTFLAVLAL